jgi:hypothetical protein
MAKLWYTCILLFTPAFLLCQGADSSSVISEGPGDSLIIKLIPLNINSSQSDFGPCLMNGQLFFVSGRNRQAAVQYVDKNGEPGITDLYCATMIDPAEFKQVQLLDGLSTKYSEGPFCFNKEGTRVYYTMNDKKTGLLKIYFSEKIKGNWVKPKPLPFCKPDFSYCHPTLSPNGKLMIFSSNAYSRDMDLCSSAFLNNEWQMPVRLSDSINSSFSEVFPFVSAGNVLYFSSDRETGEGGLDLYRFDLTAGDTSKAGPLSYPFNSSADDFGIWTDSSETQGYISSNRMGDRKDDIYYFKRNVADFSKAIGPRSKSNSCYSFVEENTYASRDTISFRYEWDFGDGTKGQGLRIRHCYSTPGNYTVRLRVLDKSLRDAFVNETAYTLTVEENDHLEIQCPDSCFAGEVLLLSSLNAKMKEYQVLDTYWFYGDHYYTHGDRVKLSYKKPGTYTVMMGIVAKEVRSGSMVQFKTEKQIVVLNPVPYKK